MERMDVPYWCYHWMFYNCTSLTKAPALPATVLSEGCYYYMFEDCTSLTQAPALPATTLDYGCYNNMFHNCISLPEPKYNMSHMTFDEVSYEIQNDNILGDWYEGDPIQVQCSDKILIATFEDWLWTITEG